MKNQRPSNTIINALLLVLAILGIYIFGNFMITMFKNTRQNPKQEVSLSIYSNPKSIGNFSLISFLGVLRTSAVQ
jgi:hypothetical protein